MASASNQRADFNTSQIAAICCEFDAACASGKPAAIDEFLVRASEEDRPELLVMLVTREMSQLRAVGFEASVELYTARFPAYAAVLRERLSGSTGLPDHSLESTVSSAAANRPPMEANARLKRLGRYELHSVIGRGAFGEVWLGWDPELKRWVAVKCLRSDRIYPQKSIDTFLHEGRKLAQMEHPLILPVLDLGQEDDQWFIVSRFIDGETLEQRLRRDGRLPPDQAAQLVAKVAEAVHHAHLHGVVHRDIKPSNILLDRQGCPYLADFGLAITEVEQLDEAPSTVGTYAYMSPEQIRGSSHLVDARSDIYSLGVVLYRVLTGRMPFVGRNRVEWAEQIESRSPRPLRTIDDSIPSQLEEACLKCLAKDLEDRYRTAMDLADDLRLIVERPVASAPKRTRKWIPISIVGVLILIIAGQRPWEPQPSNVGATSPEADLITPRQALWPDQDSVSRWSVTDEGRALTVVCEQYGLLQLSEITTQNAQLSVDITQLPWTGNVGVFWGFRRDKRARDQIHFHSLAVDRTANGFLIRRAVIFCDRITGQAEEYRGVARNEIAEPRGGPKRLTLTFTQGKLSGVQWAGEPLPDLLSTDDLAAGVDESGRVGVLVNGTGATFSNIHLNGERLRFTQTDNLRKHDP